MKKNKSKTNTLSSSSRQKSALNTSKSTSSAKTRTPRGGTIQLPSILSVALGDLFPQGKTVPAPLMIPRMVIIISSTLLLALGLVMVYSASMIKGLLQDGQDPQSFLVKQVIFAVLGLILLAITVWVGYKKLAKQLLVPLWVFSFVLLLLVAFMGSTSHGASRWIALGSFTLQPSEFAKIVLVLTAANLLADQEGKYQYDRRQFWMQFPNNGKFWMTFLGGVVVPLVLILLQPDKGTSLVLGVTLLLMMWMAGIPPRLLAILAFVCVLGFLALSLKDDYSRERFLTMIDPFEDPSGDGYQLIQGFYAFGSGGLFGLGLGLGRQKYSYLPEAHNDFIFPVIGEELGLLWCLGVLAAFAALVWASFKIAHYASDKIGQLVGMGCGLLIAVQTLLNIAGVLGIFPLTGKAVPFLSYGGSSIVSTLIIVGLLLSVSASDVLPGESEESRRGRMKVLNGPEDKGMGALGPRDRHESSFKVVEGSSRGAEKNARGARQARTNSRTTSARSGDRARTNARTGSGASTRTQVQNNSKILPGGRRQR